MPNQLKTGTLRVSYVESTKTNRALNILASARGVTVSSLMREATLNYLKTHDPEGDLTQVADALTKNLPDTPSERVIADLDPETSKKLGKILKKFKKD